MKKKYTLFPIGLVFTFGILMRLTMVFSTPILEDDFYRYLWDGAVTANGINPYKYSPDDIKKFEKVDTVEKIRLNKLAQESGDIFKRINHSYIRTIYPPITQGLFALSYHLAPWKLLPWRLLLLFIDVLNFVLIMKILKTVKKPRFVSVIYWWNPLLIKETFNSAHMDILLLPFLMCSLYFFLKNRKFPAIFSLGLAIGIKFWPIVFAPIILRRFNLSLRQFLVSFVSIVVFFLIMVLPQGVVGFDSNSAFFNYTQRWESNAALFKLFVFFSEFILRSSGIHPGFGQLMARLIAFLILLIVIYRVVRFVPEDPERQIEKFLYIITGLFLLSPTQFPWYFLWILPFLTFNPRISLLLLTALLPLYYLQYYFETINRIDVFNAYIVWFEFIPVWILLSREEIKKFKNEAVF
jgi:hypothetical protein